MITHPRLFCYLLWFGIFTSNILSAATDWTELMSFNIRYGTAKDGENAWLLRREAVFAVIHERPPHVLGLQEALRFQLDELAVVLPEHTEIGVGREDGKTKGEYAALLVHTGKFSVVSSGTRWLSDTPEQPNSRSWGNTIPRIFTYARLRERRTDAHWFVINAHFDHQSHPSRERSCDAIAAFVRENTTEEERVVFMGDLNMPTTVPALQRLLAGPPEWTDLIAGADVASGHSGTFHRFDGIPIGPRIDHIFWRGPAPSYQGEILNRTFKNRWPSDHFPVRVRLAE